MTLKYKLFGKPGNLEEFLEKAKKDGQTEIRVTDKFCYYGSTEYKQILLYYSHGNPRAFHPLFRDLYLRHSTVKPFSICYINAKMNYLEQKIKQKVSEINDVVVAAELGFVNECEYTYSKKTAERKAVKRTPVKPAAKLQVPFTNPWDIEISKIENIYLK